jgi:hypothetical protein
MTMARRFGSPTLEPGAGTATDRKDRHYVGNVLGSARAEADQEMLRKAFVETADYRALVHTRDFNHVVGRRGTGKSALFQKTKDFLLNDHNTFLIASTPTEHDTLALQAGLQEIQADYRSGRAILRLAWKLDILLSVFEITHHYKLHRLTEHSDIQNYKDSHRALSALAGPQRCAAILRTFARGDESPTELPGKIATEFRVNWLQDNVRAMLTATGRLAVALWDGLDEGWVPDQIATAVLGGLAAAVADLADSKVGIHGILFVRDNMFRALAHFDRDFSRHIEGSALRLNWDEHSLLHLVANRLRAGFDLQKAESDVKAWNRFAGRGVLDREGFELCLRHTLYRPRDLLVLLNSAYVLALREGRRQIIDADIISTSTSISTDRLDDLLKEYDTVFPGLGLFVRVFESQRAFNRYAEVCSLLDNAIANQEYRLPGSADFALFGTAEEAFFALYSVGFLGLRDAGGDHYHFCHDGAPANLLGIDNEGIVAVHPCYWRALNMTADLSEETIIIDADDEVEGPGFLPESRKRVALVQDIRTKRLGQVLEELPRIEIGQPGWSTFEDWTLRALKMLFAGKLSNIQYKPNVGNVQQRDIVATNVAQSGFWRRVREDYETRQVVVEVKNYTELGREDFRQMLSYTSGPYGRLGLVVYRTESEALTEKERAWLQEIWHEHQRMVFTIPISLLRRCVSKVRTARKHDYSDAALNKRLDTFERSYVAIKHPR